MFFCHSIAMTAMRVQTGFTLIEFLVGITLSLILTAGLLQIFQSQYQTLQNQQGLSHLQESGRFAHRYLLRVLRLAGFFNDHPFRRGQLFPDNAGSRVVEGVEGESGTGPPHPCGVAFGHRDDQPDAITVRFGGHPDLDVTDCLGVSIPTGVVSNTFMVRNNNLRCRSQRDFNGADETASLLNGVSDLQLLYGLDTGMPGSVNRYQSADAIEAADAWSMVRSIRICMKVQSADPVRKPDGTQAVLDEYVQTTVVMRNLPET